MRGLFVTGTGTGVGKTVLSAALLAAMAAAGEHVRAHKPVVTGLDEHSHTPDAWPPDHALLASAAGMAPDQVAPLRYGPAVSPHLAARMAGQEIAPEEVIARARAAGEGGHTLIVEGVGGLMVPLSDDFTVRELAVALGLPVLIAATPGLGTINHTLLTIEAARAVGLDVRAVVLTPWPGAAAMREPTATTRATPEPTPAKAATPGEMERSNRETIGRLGEVEVACLGYVPSPDPAEFASAGETLPWREWRRPQRFIPVGA